VRDLTPGNEKIASQRSGAMDNQQGTTPQPDPTSGSSYDRSISRPAKKPKDQEQAKIVKSDEAENQEAQSQKPPAPSGNP
jgi:hypothetical protein